MPSVKNPNGPSKNRLAARAAKARKANQKRAAGGGGASTKENRVAKADRKRGARTGLLPTSGPNKALSAKRRRKLEKKMGYAMKRKMEAEGEVEMKDVPEEKMSKAAEEDMAVDSENIS
ncbi:hypothetical protein F5B19DRAFT_498177 [Rostrohypoxylon terebratum]|nr:hypothetical protein F5B19DRAFT_498177 [Rostrohypoxylon terebratum]